MTMRNPDRTGASPAEARRPHGFTLIELLAVIFVIGLLMLLGITQIDFLVPKYRVRAAGREIGARLKYLKQQAITKGMPYFLHYDCPNRRYWVSAPVPVPPEELPPPPPLPPGVSPEEAAARAGPPPIKYIEAFPTTLPEGVYFTDVADPLPNSGVAVLEINPFGTTRTHYVHLADDKRSRQTTVKFNGLTGAVTYYDGYEAATESTREAD